MGYNKEEDSPVTNLNKGYGHESVKTERHNLLTDNPVAKDASGERGGSWMSKHASQSRMVSPLHEKITMTKKKTKMPPQPAPPATPPYGTVTGSGDTNELGKPEFDN